MPAPADKKAKRPSDRARPDRALSATPGFGAEVRVASAPAPSAQPPAASPAAAIAPTGQGVERRHTLLVTALLAMSSLALVLAAVVALVLLQSRAKAPAMAPSGARPRDEAPAPPLDPPFASPLYEQAPGVLSRLRQQAGGPNVLQQFSVWRDHADLVAPDPRQPTELVACHLGLPGVAPCTPVGPVRVKPSQLVAIAELDTTVPTRLIREALAKAPAGRTVDSIHLQAGNDGKPQWQVILEPGRLVYGYDAHGRQIWTEGE